MRGRWRGGGVRVLIAVYSRWNISYLSFIERALSLTFFLRDMRSRASLAEPANSMPSITTGDLGAAGEAGAGVEELAAEDTEGVVAS
jgi:hypothetical protein